MSVFCQNPCCQLLGYLLVVEIDVQLHLAVTVVGSKLSYPSVLGERQRLSENLLSADSDWLTTNSTWVAFNLDVRVKRVMNIPHKGPALNTRQDQYWRVNLPSHLIHTFIDIHWLILLSWFFLWFVYDITKIENIESLISFISPSGHLQRKLRHYLLSCNEPMYWTHPSHMTHLHSQWQADIRIFWTFYAP